MDSAHKFGVATLSFTRGKESSLIISIAGELTVNSISPIWNKAFALQKQYAPQTLVIDVGDLIYADSSGAILFFELKQQQAKEQKKFQIRNPNSELQKLLTFLEAKKTASLAVSHAPAPSLRTDFFSFFGKLLVDALKGLKENIAFLGRLYVYFFQIILHPSKYKIRYQDFWRAMEDIGPKALPIVFLIGFLVGVIITFQSAAPFSRFDAQIYIVDLVGLGLVREMGPLMTAILLAGRTASAFAAEIGSMKINQEVDALSTMGLDAIRFLVVPRMLAAIIMTPLLSMFLIISGLVGCFLIMLTLGYHPNILIQELQDIVVLQDFFAGIAKTFVFGAIVAGVGCLHGIKTQLGASAVGDSATKAVVNSLIMLTVVDGMFAVVYYVLGI